MIVLPEGARSVAEAPTAAVIDALAAVLPADAIVWWRPPFDFKDDQPELVVLDPTLGLVALEVAEARAVIAPADPGYEYGPGRRPAAHARANEFANVIKARIAGSGALRGVDVPVASLVATPDDDGAIDIGTVPGLRLVAGDLAPDRLRARLAAACGEADRDLRPHVPALRIVVDPAAQVVARLPRAHRRATADGLQIEGAVSARGIVSVLDAEQDAIARRITRADTVLSGPAGSGKTMVLVARARLLAPTGSVLLATHTRSLAAWLRRRTRDVEVDHVYGLLRRLVRDAGETWPAEVGDGEAVAAAALRAAERLDDRHRHLHLLVDEVQDLHPAVLRALLALRRPGGSTMLAVDAEQSIYGVRMPEGAAGWRALGIDADAGGNYLLRLTTCYRNTAETLAFARAVTGLGPADGIDVPRRGPRPRVALVAGVADEPEAVATAVEQAGVTGTRAGPVGVLTLAMRDGWDDARNRRAARIVDAIARRRTVLWANDPDDERARERIATAEEDVVVASAHLAKGFDFPSVVVVGLGGPSPGDGQRRAVYVALTRAVDDVRVVATPADALLSGAPAELYERV